MKDCGFRWEAKAATAHEREQKRKKEEEYELNQRYRKWEKKKRFEERINQMQCQSSLSRSACYTLNTVAEGCDEFALYQDLSGSRILMDDGVPREEEPYSIKFDSFHVKKGESWFVLGGPNSGKTSFLMALLKQMVIDLKPRPLFKMRGKFHLIDREPFIMNGTILENIMMT